MPALTVVFLVFLLAMVALRLWLAARQLRSVAAHAHAVPAPFATAVTGDEHRRAAAYTRDRVQLGRIQLLVETALLVALTIGGGFAALDALAGRLALAPLWHGVATLLALALVLGLASLPFSLYATFVVEARYGFNRTTARLFLADLARSLLLGLALGVPVIALVLTLMARAGRGWWLYAWLVWSGFSLGLSFAWPRFIAPLFNHFHRLPDGELQSRLARLIARCGFTSDGLFVMDGSRRSSHGNAYFTGLGRHKRIVLFDTLLERLQVDETEAVLAHELGHFRLHHVRLRLLLGLGTSLLFFALLGRLAEAPWFYSDLGVPQPSLQAALALFVLVVPVFTFPLAPLAAAWSRAHEFAADRYAAVHADGRALARALVKLYRDNASTLTPDPLYSAWHDSHPNALARIAALERAPPGPGAG
jgi:STE24 endopeptidase